MNSIVNEVKLNLILFFMLAIGFPFVVWLLSFASPENAAGKPVVRNGITLGFENIGQKFTSDRYFWGRPSATGNNASSTGGSNKSIADSLYLVLLNQRLEEFLKRNPGITKDDIPSDLITASGSGIDPDISVQSAIIQIKRIAKSRHLREEVVMKIVVENIKQPILGVIGTPCVNVLKLNLVLDETVGGS